MRRGQRGQQPFRYDCPRAPGWHAHRGRPAGSVVDKDGPSATGGKQGIHGLDTPRDRLRRIPPRPRAPRQRDLVPRAQQVHQFGKGVEQSIMGRRHRGGPLSETELDERVLRHPPVTTHRAARICLFLKGL